MLTGWIPERIAIRPNSSKFDADHEFDKILERFHKGHCLVTIATGNISEAVGDRAGLVPTHAYAMLDIRNVKVSNVGVDFSGGILLHDMTFTFLIVIVFVMC